MLVLDGVVQTGYAAHPGVVDLILQYIKEYSIRRPATRANWGVFDPSMVEVLGHVGSFPQQVDDTFRMYVDL